MGSASEPAPAVQAYASGVNTLNVEFDSNIPFEDENYFGTKSIQNRRFTVQVPEFMSGQNPSL